MNNEEIEIHGTIRSITQDSHTVGPEDKPNYMIELIVSSDDAKKLTIGKKFLVVTNDYDA